MTTAEVEAILTLRQFADREHRRLAVKYRDVTLAEIADLYPADGSTIRADWWDHVVANVEAGVLPSTRLWRSLDNRQQYALLRTTRALRDDAFTRALIDRSHVHYAEADHGGPATANPTKVTCPDCKTAVPA